MSFIQKLQNTSIQTKLIVPIIFIALLSMFVGSKIIDNSLNKHIFQAQQADVKNFSNKIFYLLKSDYRTLFFEFAKNEELFTQAQQATQQESINNLSTIIEGTGYDVYILDANNELIPLTQNILDSFIIEKGKYVHELVPAQKTTLLSNKFVYKLDFKPWNWTIVTIKNTSVFEEIILQNNRLVFATISFLMIAIILILFIVIFVVIQKPFKKVFDHLNQIKQNKITTPLKSDQTKETQLLAWHINSMNDAIVLRENQLIANKIRNDNILNSQPSIVTVSDGSTLKYANAAFFELFNEFKSLSHFLKYHNCICDFFEKIDKEGYIYNQSNVNWIEEIINSTFVPKVLIKRGEQYYTYTIIAKKIGHDKNKNEFVVNLVDITRLEKYKEQLESSREKLSIQLHTDELTKLPNRLSLSEDLLNDEIVTLILININDFKEVNDFYGTGTGDKILFDYGQTLHNFCKNKPFTVYKLSADEFALLKTEYESREVIIAFVKKLQQQMKTYDFYDLTNTRKINITSTIGAAINRENSTIFVNADIALKTAKKKKRPFMTYKESQATKDEFAANIEWANRLKNAFLKDKVIPYFQPIIDNKTQKITKYESLVRLIDENDNPISPFFFLEIAKKSHQYMQLTETMIEKTFEYFKDKDYAFSINLSERDLSDFAINAMVIEKLKKYDIGEKVVFEIVESENIDDYEMVGQFIREVKKYGAKIAIDDFGAGFSNFQHVSQLNVDFIKIDGSLIQNILNDKNSLTIVEAIATFAKRLGIKTVAEFVDSAQIQSKVTEMGIDYTQGYYIGEPKPYLLS